MKLYRLLLSLYPARFREEYGGPLEQQFTDEYREATTVGTRFKLWLAVLSDLAWSIPVELAHELRQDLWQSLRVHARRPFLMIFTVTILALAIGGATGVFSVVNAVLIKALPFRDPSRLVVLSGWDKIDENPMAFQKWRTSSAYLEDSARVMTAEMTVGEVPVPTRVNVAQTSFNFFSLLGSEPMLGRAFAPTEDVPGNDNVAIISHSLWQQLYAGDPRVLGSTIVLNGVPQTIIGVARPGFDYPQKSSVWTPTAFNLTRLPNKGAAWSPFGRLKSGVTFAQAEQMYEAEVAHDQPNRSLVWTRDDSPFPPPRLIPLRAHLAENIREAALTLMVAIGFVLLIACANVANLLLTRTSERRNELVIRAALGASRARLAQQLLSESLLLSFISAAAGLVIAYAAAKFATLTEPAAMAAQEYTILDWRVLCFAVGIAALTGILFGVVPAMLVRHLQPSADVARMNNSGQRTARLRTVLITMQVALTLVLLAGSMTIGRGFLQLLGTNLGFRTEHMVSLNVSLAGTGLNSPVQKSAYYRAALGRLRGVSGVESAAAAYTLPLDSMFGISSVVTDSGVKTPALLDNRVTPDYFRTMNSPILQGRDFTDKDGPNVAIVSEGAARRIAGESSVLGRKITPQFNTGKEPLTIVGVVRAARYAGPQGPVMDQFYMPLDRAVPDYATFIVRVHGDASDSLAVCRDAVQSVDPHVPVFNVKTLQQRLDQTLAVPRFRTTVFLFFGGFALLLAIAGIYGVCSYSITQRRREIGVRIAIGASAQRVRSMILRQALFPIGLGTIIGFTGAAWQSRLLEHLMSSAPAIDTQTCLASAALLVIVAIAAIWIATQRVLELNPVEVLKAE